jgi:hypothetical protein
MTKFSQRKGYEPVSEVIQTDGMDENLRNSLWNALDISMRNQEDFFDLRYPALGIGRFSTLLWVNYFKVPFDTRPGSPFSILQEIREYFFSCEWYEVYDFLEFVLNNFSEWLSADIVNRMLERELSGYRFIDGIITPITDKQEIDMLESVLTDQDFPSVRKHLRRALELLSNREQPDYRNSIKESISAVESLARVVTDSPKATLGKALKVLGHSDKIHPLLEGAFSKLYGYTSDEGGIRHAMLDDPNLSAAEAKLFLMLCTAFVNYLKSKM